MKCSIFFSFGFFCIFSYFIPYMSNLYYIDFSSIQIYNYWYHSVTFDPMLHLMIPQALAVDQVHGFVLYDPLLGSIAMVIAFDTLLMRYVSCSWLLDVWLCDYHYCWTSSGFTEQGGNSLFHRENEQVVLCSQASLQGMKISKQFWQHIHPPHFYLTMLHH